MNIYEKINEVRKKVSYAQKDATVQGYRAVTHDAVTALLRNHLVEQGIIVVPSLFQAPTILDVGQTNSGTTIIRYQAQFDVSFVNAAQPEDRVTLRIDAHANDHGDKAPGKAMSYATKYAMLKLFSIETGEDDEGRVEPYEMVKRITAEQTAELTQLIEASEIDVGRFIAWASKAAKTELFELADLPEKLFEQAKRLIGTKKAAA